MIVRDATYDDIHHVVANLRPEDVEEQFAARFDDDRMRLTADIAALRGLAIKQIAACPDDGRAATIVTAYLKTPSVAGIHMCSTPRFAEIARDAHRYTVRRFIPAVLVPNVAMAESRILATHLRARRWIAACGFREVGEPLPYGRDGEAYVHVAWINEGRAGDVR